MWSLSVVVFAAPKALEIIQALLQAVKATGLSAQHATRKCMPDKQRKSWRAASADQPRGSEALAPSSREFDFTGMQTFYIGEAKARKAWQEFRSKSLKYMTFATSATDS